ncbi:MAG: nuclear transport factor 2 family protein [Thermoplasmata archaeon]|nr:nuclear transport factor 2 family protein [Thermoplasmata archaeon]
MDAERIIAQFTEAWNANDPEERRRLIEATCTEATEIVSPYGAHRGISSQLEDIDQVRRRFPKAKCTAKVLVQHHGWVMASWTTEFGDAHPPLHGADVTLIDDAGRIVKVISFSPLPEIKLTRPS